VTDLLEHLLLTCDAVVPDRADLRIAALLHDIGKPGTMEESADGTISFHGHAERSAEMSEEILTRLRFPTRTIRYVRRLVAAHMIHYRRDWSDAAVRRFINRVGPDAVWDLIALQRADLQGKQGEAAGTRRSRAAAARQPRLEELEDRVRTVLDADAALSLRDLAVNGRDLQDEAGIPPGPELGTVLDFLLETVLEDPKLNIRDRLLDIARNFYEERIRPGSGKD
jgi:putative nucleotidyltransferase with HDIG domain